MTGLDPQPQAPALSAQRFTALVLAGNRPGGDPLARAAGVSHKALAPVAGIAMLTRVVRTLRATPAVQRIVVCGIDRDALTDEAELRALIDAGHVALIDARATPSASVLYAMQQLAPCTPLLVATADHPLLTPQIVETFCARAAQCAADVAVALVRAQAVHSTFPALRRTTLPFRDGAYCGCNLYALLTSAAQRVPAEWMQVEQHRKQPWRMVSALGAGVMLRFLLRRLTLPGVMETASERLGVRVSPIFLAQAEAGFDVDTPAQLATAEAFLRVRETQNALAEVAQARSSLLQVNRSHRPA
jgi:GTP:adenosylcobinamide-phosphate guanylyltransferase